MNEELQYFEQELIKLRPDKPLKEIKKDALGMARQRYVKGRDGWVLRNNIASELSVEDFFKLMISRDTLPTEPYSSAQEKEVINAFNSYPYSFRLVGKMEVTEGAPTPAFFEYLKKGSIKNTRPNDYILMKSILCTSLPFVNANGDAFRAEDMLEAVESGQMDKLQPAIVDWHHDFQVYGSTIGAEVVDKEIEITGIGKNTVKQIIVYSVFHAWRFPQKAGKIRKWAEKNVLGFSMACGAEKATYLNGGSIRVLEKPHFVANSIIPPDGDPADDNARLLEIAEKKDKIPVIYASYSEVPKNLTCAWYNPDNNKPEINTGEDMDNTKKIEELEATIVSLKEENARLKESESTKKISVLEAELAALKTEQENHNTVVADLNDKIQKAEDAKIAAEQALSVANSALKDFRKDEVDRINVTRKASITEVVGNDESKVNFWFEKYKAGVDENGNIVNPKDEFEQAMNAMPKVVTVETTTKIEGDNLGDIDASEKVKRSMVNPAIATASSKEEKSLFPNSIA
jgi:hypothetical protein